MASRGRRSAQAREDEQRRVERGEQQALAPQGPTVLPPPPPVDYGAFMQGNVSGLGSSSRSSGAWPWWSVHHGEVQIHLRPISLMKFGTISEINIVQFNRFSVNLTVYTYNWLPGSILNTSWPDICTRTNLKTSGFGAPPPVASSLLNLCANSFSLLLIGNGITYGNETVKAKGIPLCSKCSCCSSPQEESAIHLFFRSEIACKVWAELFHLLQFHNQQQIFVPTVVKWMHPPTGRIKLNVDGAFKSATGIAGGGVILRDHNGDCIFAFAANYQGTTSALDAEARALRDGLAMCCTKGFLDIMVETDSLSLTQSVTGQALRPWELTCIFQEMVATFHLLTTKITQVPREANQTAHYLASYGCSIDQIDFWESGAVLPHTIKGPYRLDKVGCPTLRT
ncbi:hypothetical protein Taro_010190 [Colocasia esculenta]|uniref:RNase H type-1 domain-containing protein n=1 Tax=Colocasia esculenta TaxID=4460 RepID=A0A843U6X7_COLES|nr:hypothetical protein [Colocasia esculenta]